MSLISEIRNFVGNHLRAHTLVHHKSPIFFWEARKYTKYLKHCQTVAPIKPSLESPIKEAVADFKRQGVSAFRTDETASLAQSMLEKLKAEEGLGLSPWGEDGRYTLGDPFIKFPEIEALFNKALGPFFTGVMETHYAIYYMVMYKSVRNADKPALSQLWHRDGAPGTCINLMFCLSETSAQNGAMKCLPWQDSLEMLLNDPDTLKKRLATASAENPTLSRLELREVKCDSYREQIEAKFQDKIIQPTGGPGIVYAFRNNCVHAGGFPDPGHERYVCVFHIYPSCRPINLKRYVMDGAKKCNPYPKTPDELDLLT